MSIKSWILVPFFALSFLLMGCEDDEANKLMQAQECLNEATTAAAAAACESFVSGLNTTESWAIRCSARTLGGGLDENTIVTAYDAADAAPSGQFEATLMTNLTLTAFQAPNASIVAQAAYAFDACSASEVDGLIYLGGIVNVGTQIVANGFTTGTNPDQYIDYCEANPGNCNATEIGEVAIAVADSYCNGGNEDSEICTAINSAIAAGGNAATIGQNLFNLIDPNTGT